MPLASSSNPNWLFASNIPTPEKPAHQGWGKESSKQPSFDGRDRVGLGNGWFLIRGDDSFFLELAGSGIDLSQKEISTSPLII
jgi:hypothetical protein